MVNTMQCETADSIKKIKTSFIHRFGRRALVICNTHSTTAREVTFIAGVLFLRSIRYRNRFTAISSLILYFVLGVLLIAVVYTNIPRLRYKPFIAAAAGLLVAAADETHQMFVPGRGASVGDVILDTISVTAGVLALMGVRTICRKRKKRSLTL